MTLNPGWRHVAPLDTTAWRQLASAAVRRWRAGESVCKLMCALRMQATLTAFDGKVPDLEWSELLVTPESWVCEPFARILQLGEVLGGRPNIGLQTATTFALLKTLQVSDLPPWFRLSAGLAHSLLGTRLRGVRPSEVLMPFPGLYIELPPNMLYVDSADTGTHEARAVCLAEGCPSGHSALASIRLATGNTDLTLEELKDHPEYTQLMRPFGRRLMIVCYCEPNERSASPEDDNILYCSLPLYDDQASIEHLVTLDDEIIGTDGAATRRGGELLGDPITLQDVRQLLRSFAVNFLLYLSSPKADRVHVEEARIRALSKGKKTRRVRDLIKKLQAKPEWDVGSRVRVDPYLQEAVRRAGRGGRSVATNILVRGHWRRQWHGPKTDQRPKGQDWHWTWIAPTVRNPASGKVFGHEYVLGE